MRKDKGKDKSAVEEELIADFLQKEASRGAK